MDITIEQGGKISTEFALNDMARSAAQNVLMILNTRRGSVPNYREFGLPMEFIDKPVNVAETIATLEISEALEKFEPRAALKNLEFIHNSSGKTVLKVEVNING